MAVLIISGLFVDQSLSMGKNIFHEDVIQGVNNYLTGSGVWAFVIYWAVVIILTQIFLQVRDNFGYGVLSNFILGRYYKPKEERRIFMFLDIRSSTTIAEQIGHIQYHNLLNNFFDDINDSIIFSKGEIYQYVGDEITVSWKFENGIENQNCLQCYFNIKDLINKNSSRYIEKFGLVPEFKAGLHVGKVTVAEVGEIKKELAFHGDAINTAARIQSKCNQLQKRLLVSEAIKLKIEDQMLFEFTNLGDVTLKGKTQPVSLYDVSPC
jgi:adenylate cyclase